jgi:hypothetical protein
MSISLNAIIAVKLWTGQESQLGLCVLHYRCNADTTGIGDAAIAGTFEALWAPLVLPCMTSQAIWLGVNIQQIWPSLGVPARSQALLGPGTDGALPMSKQTTGLVTKLTNLGGRAYRGRMYIPFPSTSSTTADAVPSAGYLTKLQAIGYAVFAPAVYDGSHNFTPVLFHKAFPALSTTIVQARVGTAWATQRRRGDYGKLNSLVIPG